MRYGCWTFRTLRSFFLRYICVQVRNVHWYWNSIFVYLCFSMKLMKSSGILHIGLLQLRRRLGQCLHKRWYSLGRALATWDIDLPTGIGTCIFVSLKNVGIPGGLEVCESQLLVMSSMCLPWRIWSVIALSLFCMFFTIGALRGCGYSWWLLYLCLLFFRFKTELFFNSFKAITSLRDELFFGLVTVISASCVLTFS